MSTDSAGGVDTTPTKLDHPIFRSQGGDPIRFNSNPATINGIMYEIEKAMKRTGDFRTFLQHRAVELSNGGLAIESSDAIPFIEGTLTDGQTYDFNNPCPSTAVRYHRYNVDALSATPRRSVATPTNSAIPKEQSRNYIAADFKVKAESRKFMQSLAYCFDDCEAEIIALSEAAKDVVYLRKFISGMTGNQIKWPTQLRTDNKAARDLSYNPEIHNRTKHVARRHFFIRDMVEAFELNVPLVSTVNNFADFFTKALTAKSVGEDVRLRSRRRAERRRSRKALLGVVIYE